VAGRAVSEKEGVGFCFIGVLSDGESFCSMVVATEEFDLDWDCRGFAFHVSSNMRGG
jgi:hypothetical protein